LISLLFESKLISLLLGLWKNHYHLSS